MNRLSSTTKFESQHHMATHGHFHVRLFSTADYFFGKALELHGGETGNNATLSLN